MNTTKDHSTPSPFLPLETKLKQITSLVHRYIYNIYIYIYNYILRCLILDVRSFCTIPSKKCGTCWLDPRTKGLQIVPHYLRWEKLGFINVGLGPNQGQTSQTCFSRSCCAESTHSILKSIALQVWEHWKEETWRCKEHPKNQRISKKIKEPKLEKKTMPFFHVCLWRLSEVRTGQTFSAAKLMMPPVRKKVPRIWRLRARLICHQCLPVQIQISPACSVCSPTTLRLFHVKHRNHLEHSRTKLDHTDYRCWWLAFGCRWSRWGSLRCPLWIFQSLLQCGAWEAYSA